MQSAELSGQLRKLETLMRRVEEACGQNEEMQAEWAKYLCVRSTGFLENGLREVFSTVVRAKSDKAVERFAVGQLNRINNPKTKRFLEVTAAFKKSWRDELKDFVERDGRGDAINSIMNNRHKIAHGEDSEITMVRLKEYLAKSVEVVSFLETLVLA